MGAFSGPARRAAVSALATAIAVLLMIGGPVASSRARIPKTLLSAVPPRAVEVTPDPVGPTSPDDPNETAAPPPLPVATLRPSATDPPAPPFAPVETTRAAVSVLLADESAQAALRAVVADLDGVTNVAVVASGPVQLGGVAADLAAVDPMEFRPFTPDATANHADLWGRVEAGDVVVTHEFGTGHEVPLGGQLEVTPRGVPVRVGAFATNGTPPVADAIVHVDRADELLGTAAVTTLLIGLEREASPEATVNALRDAGFEAEEIPDPRLPNSQTVVPPGGITPENVWDHLAMCESSGDWHINTGNGYYGGIQFLPESWWAVGGTGLPHEHTREEQIYRGTLLWQIQGWEAWPQCARKLGLIVDPPPDQ